jgi:hypothetical protein
LLRRFASRNDENKNVEATGAVTGGAAATIVVIPARRETASPESITTARGYGVRACVLRTHPAMTAKTEMQTGEHS